MVFSFGAASTSAPAFGASPSPFGGISTAFGAQSSQFSFASSTPAFGASQPAASPGLFGAQSAPAFGATPSLFGAQSTPAFGSATPASSSAFSFANTGGSLFGSSTPAFGTGGGGLLGQQAPAQTNYLALVPAPQAQQQPQASAQYQVLVTKDNKPIVHSTAWDDIHPEGQKYLLELEKQVLQYREESRQLDECERLRDGRQLKQGLKQDERAVKQLLQTLENDLRVSNDTIAAFRERVLQLLRDTETGVRAFQRSHKWREAAKASQGQVLPPAVREQLSGAVVLPSLFLRDTIPSFQEGVAQYAAIVEDLERVLKLAGGAAARGRPGAEDALAVLPGALANLHALLVNVAARLDGLHERLADAKQAHLDQLAAAGDDRDPFAEAEERERRRSQDAKRRLTNIHSTAQPALQAPAAASSPLLALGSAPASAPAPAPGGFFSGLATAQPAASAAAPSTGLFGGGGGLFGSPAAGTPGLFGQAANNPAPLQRQPSVRKGKSRK